VPLNFCQSNLILKFEGMFHHGLGYDLGYDLIPLGPTTLLGAARAPLYHYFILIILLEYF
jgi:hypothetical protein